jgi:hypothetical protein
LRQTLLTKGATMKGFIFFKNYPTKTEFNAETNKFEEQSVRQDFEQHEAPKQIDPQAPLALTYLMLGLKQPNRRSQKF